MVEKLGVSPTTAIETSVEITRGQVRDEKEGIRPIRARERVSDGVGVSPTTDKCGDSTRSTVASRGRQPDLFGVRE